MAEKVEKNAQVGVELRSAQVAYTMQPDTGRDGSKGFFFDVEALPWPEQTLRKFLEEADEATREKLIGVFGRTLRTKKILTSPSLSVTWVKVEAGDHVKPHSHGTNQLSFVLKGSLVYGNRVIGPGMGRFGPNRPYSWTAGPEGAEFLEIHDGTPKIYFGE